jgi:hypothetical protein
MLNLSYIDTDWNVYDGAHLPDCTDINKAQFSYNAAILLQGAAFLYNYVCPIYQPPLPLWPRTVLTQTLTDERRGDMGRAHKRPPHPNPRGLLPQRYRL